VEEREEAEQVEIEDVTSPRRFGLSVLSTRAVINDRNCWAAGSSPWVKPGRLFSPDSRYKPMWFAPKANIV